MNWDIIQGDWEQFKRHVKEKWSKLTDNHLDKIAGKRDELVEKIQKAYGVTKNEAERQIKGFEERYMDYLPKNTNPSEGSAATPDAHTDSKVDHVR
jgi:uncharacterized protein YjbJ (UPF0337 family)